MSALAISFLLYFLGSGIAPKDRKDEVEPGKLAPYACGEDIPTRKFQVDIQRFFLYVTVFMIFDVSAFVLALSFTADAVYPILFSLIVATSLLTVIPVIGRRKK